MRTRCTIFLLIAFGLAISAGHAIAQHAPPPPPPPPHGSAPGGVGGPSGPRPSNGGSNTNASSQTRSAQASSSGTGSLQFGPPGRWWDDSNVRQAVGLRAAQQKRMDSIFDSNKSAIVSSYQELMTQQSKLDSLNRQANVDSKALFSQIDSVNTARAKLQKATSEMLLQLRGQMDATQLEKLQSIK